MPNAKKIVIANHKGGVGKTTTTYCLAAAKAKTDKMVLMIDLDFQYSLTLSCGMFRKDNSYKNTSASELFNAGVSLPDLCFNVTPAHLEKLFIIPGSDQLAVLPEKITANPSLIEAFKNNINGLSKFFDYIFIDLGPTLNSLLTAALLVADEVIVPVKPELISVAGLDIFVNTIKEIQKAPKGSLGNKKLRFDGIIINMYRSVVREHNNYLEMLNKNFNVLGVIPNSAIVTKEIENGRPVTLAHPSSTVAKTFFEIANNL